MGETDRQRRAREASHRYFTEALARMFDPDRKNGTAARIVDLWDARRARGAEPLFHPTIGGAIRAVSDLRAGSGIEDTRQPGADRHKKKQRGRRLGDLVA